jgi:hypothetical protein
MSVTVHSHWQFIADGEGDLFAYGDKLMQALLDQEECTSAFKDVAVAADTGRGLLEIEANTSGDTLSEAIATTAACVRAGLHEVGIGTPDWPTHDEAMSILLKDLRQEPLVDV